LKEEDAGDILVMGGGAIPEAGAPASQNAGIAETLVPGAPTSTTTEFIKQNVDVRGR